MHVAVLARMGDAIVHRGPDDSGAFSHGELLLGMRRLSIIDVAGGHQPIASEDGQVVAVCNGEIYNFRELRRELEAAGHRFATNSDSEVVVHAYEQHGDAFLNRLDGMFGLALWDCRRRRLIPGARCHRHQADLLPSRRPRTDVCLRSQGSARGARGSQPSRSGCAGAIPFYRLRRCAQCNFRGHEQAASRARH